MTRTPHNGAPQELPRDPEKLREYPFQTQTPYALAQHFVMVLATSADGHQCHIYSRDDSMPWRQGPHVMMGSGRTMVDAMHNAVWRLDVLYRELERDRYAITDMEISLDSAVLCIYCDSIREPVEVDEDSRMCVDCARDTLEYYEHRRAHSPEVLG